MDPSIAKSGKERVKTVNEIKVGTILAYKARSPGGNMTKKQLLQKIALLETINDHLSTEVTYVDELMKMVGFAGGLETIKATAREIIKKGLIEQHEIT
jgi:endonuclease III